MTNKILDKFGVYDLVGVLLAGISIFSFTLLVLQFVYGFSIDIDLQVNETLAFFVVSYFLGLVFQELGSVLQKREVGPENILLKEVMCDRNDLYTCLTEGEMKGICEYVGKEMEVKNDNREDIYNYCKFYVMKNCDTSRIDRDQSLSAMSRSLALYFALLAIGVFGTVVYEPSVVRVLLAFGAFAVALLLQRRCVRFVKLRYVNILRMFYYDKVENKENTARD